MILKLIENIASILNEKYSDFEVINDKIVQGFGKTFHIQIIDSEIKRVVGVRNSYKVNLMIDIYSEDVNEITNIGSKLLEYIEVVNLEDDLIRGINYSFNIRNDIGHVSIEYNFWKCIRKDEDPMMTYKHIQEGVKN